MATSGALSTSNQYVKYTITVTEKTQDVANNKTTVDVSVRFYRTNTGYSTYGTGTVYCRINGTQYSAAVTPSQKITNSGIVLFSKTGVSIPHNADGSKTLSVSAWISHNAPLTSSEQSYNQKLTTIPRASQPSCITYPNHTQNVGNFGATISIHTNRKSSSFTHTVRYAFGNSSGTCIDADTGKAATGVTNGIRWKIPDTLMNLIPNATSGSGTIYVDTYNGTSKIGTKSCGFTATVPASVKPSCSIQVLDETDTKDTYGNLVSGKSKLRINVTGTTAQGSPIAVYSSTVTISSGTGAIQEMVYSGASVVTAVLPFGGTVTVSSSVIDGRGRQGYSTVASFTVLNYEQPQITSLTVHRCDEDGAENISGANVRVNFTAAITSLNSKNKAVYAVKYKKSSETNYTTVTMSDIKGYSVSGEYIFAADTGSSYDVAVVATDDFGAITRSASVSTADTVFNISADGTGFAFGKVSESSKTLENNRELRQIANSYAFQPSSFNGDKGWTLIARIRLNTLNVNAPIVFVINKRGALCPMTVYVRFASSSSTTDPALGSITYEGDNYGACLVKEAVSTWKLYVDNSTGWTNPCLQEWYTTNNQNARLSVDFPSEQPSELPQGLLGYFRATPAKMQSILDYVYPVGSIYLSYSHVSPADIFGGSWTRLSNTFLWAVDASGTIGQTGGEKTHTLTTNELPSHTHGAVYTGTEAYASGAVAKKDMAWYTASGSGLAYGYTYAGGGWSHNNMPPYTQISAWRRVS